MNLIRHSSDSATNKKLLEKRAQKGELNSQWLKRNKATQGVLLIGGSSLAHFKIRVAQAHLRDDMLPSFWSMVGILNGTMLHTVTLEQPDTSEVPKHNGVVSLPIEEYDDPFFYPNMALIHFTAAFQEISSNLEEIRSHRSIIDIPSLIVAWLSYVWGTGHAENPLLNGNGLPSAACVETIYGMARIELTPGLASSASCPEAIWQAAKWWKTYYEETAKAEEKQLTGRIVPTGFYVLRQPAAAVCEKKDAASRSKK